jgi:hypothetical protein
MSGLLSWTAADPPKTPPRRASPGRASPGRFVSAIRSGTSSPSRGLGSPARYTGSPRSRSPGRLGGAYSSPMRTLSPSRTVGSPSRTTASPSRTLSTIRHVAPSSPSRSSSRAVMSPARRRDATVAFGGARSASSSAPAYVVAPLSLPPRQPRKSARASSPQRSAAAAAAAAAAQQSVGGAAALAEADAVAGMHSVDAARLALRAGPVDLGEQRLRVAALEKWADEERQKLLEAERRVSRPFAARPVRAGDAGRADGLGVSATGISADSVRESTRQQNAVARRRLAEDRAMRREESARNADSMLRIFQSPAERVKYGLESGKQLHHSPVRTREFKHPQSYGELLGGSEAGPGESQRSQPLSTSLNLVPGTPATPVRDRQPPPPTPADQLVAPQPQPQPEPEPEQGVSTASGADPAAVEDDDDDDDDSDYSSSDDE